MKNAARKGRRGRKARGAPPDSRHRAFHARLTRSLDFIFLLLLLLLLRPPPPRCSSPPKPRTKIPKYFPRASSLSPLPPPPPPLRRSQTSLQPRWKCPFSPFPLSPPAFLAFPYLVLVGGLFICSRIIRIPPLPPLARYGTSHFVRI